ncbi:MAG: hypothetical protein GJV46_14990 [Geobacter sp.]|nr:hypothetical protein [Geobacter sp.]
MRKFLVILAFSSVSSFANAATPSISNVTGTIATGQVLTITGTNMVQEDNTNWLNLSSNNKSPNFKGTAYGFEGTRSADGYCAAGLCDGVYDANTKLMGNQSVKYNTRGASQWPGSGYITSNDGFYSPTSPYYFRAYYRYHNQGSGAWPTSDMKLFIQQCSSSNAYWQAGMNNGNAPNNMLIFSQVGGTTSSSSYSFPMALDVWYEIEGSYSQSTKKMELWLNGVYKGSRTIDATTPNYFVMGQPTTWNTNSTFSLDVNIDNLAMSTTRVYPSCLVEISGDNGSTWRIQNFVNIGSNAALSDTVATILADLPAKSASDYLVRVTNNQQQVSSVYNLSGGGGGGVSDTQAPSVPSNLISTATTANQINLSWSSSTDNTAVAGYKIYRDGTYVTTVNGAQYIDSGLSASTSYSYKVSAIDAVGNESGQSSSSTATTLAAVITDMTAPSVPTGLSASSISASQINLLWTASTDNVGVTGYKIYRGGVYVATATGTSYPDSGLTASTSYSYRVSAIDAAGNESSQSSSISTSTQADSVQGTQGTTLFKESFEDSNFSSRGWYDNTSHGTIVTGGQSGNCLQWAWAKGATSATNGASMRMKFAPTDSLYLSFYVKFQTGWRGSQQTYHPHMLYFLSNLDSDYSALANNYLDTYIEFLSDVGSPYAIRPQIAIQDNLRVNSSLGTPPNNLTATTENRSVASCNTPTSSGATGTCYNSGGWYSANTWLASNASVSTNDWHRVEVYFKMNTISGGKGQSDGIMQQWIDGVKVMDNSDVLYRTNQDATKKWAQFVLAPFMGDGAPIAETMWIDELSVSTSSPYVSVVSAPTVTIKSVSSN